MQRTRRTTNDLQVIYIFLYAQGMFATELFDRLFSLFSQKWVECWIMQKKSTLQMMFMAGEFENLFENNLWNSVSRMLQKKPLQMTNMYISFLFFPLGCRRKFQKWVRCWKPKKIANHGGMRKPLDEPSDVSKCLFHSFHSCKWQTCTRACTCAAAVYSSSCVLVPQLIKECTPTTLCNQADPFRG